MNRFVLWFVKITGLPIQYFYYKKKIYTENNNKKLKAIKGGALLVSNHTSVYDYPLIMYTFLKRSIRTLVAEVIFEKGPFMSKLMTHMGAIRVDRNSYDFAFMSQMINVLKAGQLGLVFPESRVPLKEERDNLLEFKPSYVYLALESNVPIIPIYTNGIYGKQKKEHKDRARIIIGEPIFVNDLYDENLSDKENINEINAFVRNKIISLRGDLENFYAERG